MTQTARHLQDSQVFKTLMWWPKVVSASKSWSSPAVLVTGLTVLTFFLHPQSYLWSLIGACCNLLAVSLDTAYKVGLVFSEGDVATYIMLLWIVVALSVLWAKRSRKRDQAEATSVNGFATHRAAEMTAVSSRRPPGNHKKGKKAHAKTVAKLRANSEDSANSVGSADSSGSGGSGGSGGGGAHSPPLIRALAPKLLNVSESEGSSDGSASDSDDGDGLWGMNVQRAQAEAEYAKGRAEERRQKRDDRKREKALLEKSLLAKAGEATPNVVNNSMTANASTGVPTPNNHSHRSAPNAGLAGTAATVAAAAGGIIGHTGNANGNGNGNGTGNGNSTGTGERRRRKRGGERNRQREARAAAARLAAAQKGAGMGHGNGNMRKGPNSVIANGVAPAMGATLASLFGERVGFLRGIGMERTASSKLANISDAKTLLGLTDVDFHRLGINPAWRPKIHSAFSAAQARAKARQAQHRSGGGVGGGRFNPVHNAPKGAPMHSMAPPTANLSAPLSGPAFLTPPGGGSLGLMPPGHAPSAADPMYNPFQSVLPPVPSPLSAVGGSGGLSVDPPGLSSLPFLGEHLPPQQSSLPPFMSQFSVPGAQLSGSGSRRDLLYPGVTASLLDDDMGMPMGGFSLGKDSYDDEMLAMTSEMASSLLD